MAMADTFSELLESLPDDWTDLELDLRIAEERRYVDAAVLLVTCNAQPYSKHDWHWRILVAHRFGHAAGVPAGLWDRALVGTYLMQHTEPGVAPVLGGVDPATWQGDPP